jgi:PTH1 family peptidyl-tRNA hydrolase
MILIVGLGNPGNEYENTRHNLGFMAIDELKEFYGFPEFEFAKKFNGLVSQGILAENEAILLKPQTYMNESGKAVKAVSSFYKIPVTNIYVVHDEADVPLGQIKVSQNVTSAGHRGVQSIIDEFNSKDFSRFRIGIDSDDPSYRKALAQGEGLENVVLKNFSEQEKPAIEDSLKQVVELIPQTIIEKS